MRPCVIIPVYNNPRTAYAVGAACLQQVPDVLVVDDGSTDATVDAVAALEAEGAVVVRHERNRGKGAALRTGLQEAQRRGFSHAVAIDADGQHLAEDIPVVLEAARREPTALIIGARDLEAAGAGRGSRWGRANSNLWTFIETGLRLPDTQSGFRCYPVEAVNALHLRTTGYDLEIEVLVKAAWAGVPVVSVPIRVHYPRGKDRVSHLRPFWDFLRIGRLNTRLVAMRICLPAPYLALRVTRRFHAMRLPQRVRTTLRELFVEEPGSTGRIALSTGLGLFMGIAPVWGFQIALTLVLAHLLGLSKPIAVVASNISFPLMIPPILYASLVVGRLTLGTADPTAPVHSLEVAAADVPAWIVGSLVLASAVAIVGALASYLAVGAIRSLRGTVKA